MHRNDIIEKFNELCLQVCVQRKNWELIMATFLEVSGV